jgi:enamine deaminase RidA (YjgF/YER057c/UK114 family)
MRKRIYSGAPLEKKVGYCRATRVGDLVFVSGSTAMKDGQGVGVGDAAAQTRQIVATIEKALREAGSSMDEVVRYRLFVTNADDFPAVLKVLSETFGGIHPCGTGVVVTALVRPELVVEIEVDAVIGSATPVES